MDIKAKIQAALERYQGMSAADKAAHDYAQRRSFVRGMCPFNRDFGEWCEAVDRVLPPRPEIPDPPPAEEIKHLAEQCSDMLRETERLRHELEVSEAVNRAKTELLMDVAALLADGDCTPGQQVMNARTAIALRTAPPKSAGA